MAMVAIRADRIIIRPQRRNGPDGDGFLPNVEMEKPRNLRKRIHLRRFLFKPADQEHLPVQKKEVVAVHELIMQDTNLGLKEERGWSLLVSLSRECNPALKCPINTLF